MSTNADGHGTVLIVQDFQAVAQFVRKKTRPFQVNDQYLNGPQFAEFIKQTVGDVNDGTPLIPTAIQRLAMLRNAQVSRACLAAYQKVMSRKGVTDSMMSLQEAHTKAIKYTKETLSSVRFCSMTMLATCQMWYLGLLIE